MFYQNYLVRVLFSVYGWIVIGIVCIVIFFLEILLFGLTYPFDPNRIYVGRFFRYSSVLASKLMPLWDYKIYGELPKEIPKRTVFVCNHRSLADSNLLSLLPWEMKYLVKKSMTLMPFVGWSMILAGDIPLKRGHKESTISAMKRCAKYLKDNVNVMIFPEGTRTLTGEIGDFKDGAFRLAIETQSDLCPLAIAGTENSLAVSSLVFGVSKGVVTVGKPISTKGMTLNDISKLKREAKEQILSMYKEILPLSKI